MIDLRFSRIRRRIQRLGAGEGRGREELLADILRRLDEIQAVALMPTGERFTHLKRGTTYDVYGVGHANSSEERELLTVGGSESAKVLFDRDEVVIYRDVQSGAISVRQREEFLDGRFALVPPGPGQMPPDPATALVERPRATGLSPALGVLTDGSEKPLRRVMDCGPDPKNKGRLGWVEDWNGDGTAVVRWDDLELGQRVNTLNIQPAPEER